MARLKICAATVQSGTLALTIALGAALPAAPAMADDVPGVTTTSTSTSTSLAPTSLTEPPTRESPPTSTAAATTTPTPPTSTSEPTPASSDSRNQPGDTPTASAETLLADLHVTAAFDKEWYLRDSTVKVTITVTNNGTAAAYGVRAYSNIGGIDLIHGWGDLGAEPGATIGPGTTRIVELSGRIASSASVSLTFNGTIFYSTGSGYDAEYFSLSAWIVEALGDFGGVIFTDSNVNGVADPGEIGLAGVIVDIYGHQPAAHYQQTTDAQGRFSFPGIPGGEYSLRYSTPHPWIVYGFTGKPFDESVVISDSPQYSDVRLPAVRSLSESLQVSMFFGRDTYRADETVHLTVVLTNSGGSTLAGLTARCQPIQDMPRLSGGPGWGPLAEGGPGVTLPAGESRLVMVSEPVPAAAPRFGYVSASCEFSAPGYPVDAAVSTRATAKVPGVPGTGRARIFHDIDGDYHLDEGEGVANATVVITDPDTGAAVARLTTDASGAFAVDGLPATVYDVRIDGPWKPRSDIYGFQLPVVAGRSWSGEPWFAVVPGSAADNRRPNLKVSAAFEKPVYNSDDTMRVRLIVTNIGEAAAEGVRLQSKGQQPAALPVMSEDLKELGWFGPLFGSGARIEAGATRVIEIEATISNPQGAVIFSGFAQATGYDINSDNNEFGAVAAVIATRGTYTGVLYGDRNNNGVMDPGEAFSWTPIRLDGGIPRSEFLQSTDTQGRFALRDIPTGRYDATYFVPAGWLFASREIVVKEGEQPEVLIRAIRPPKEFLQAAIALDKDTYSVGEIAHLTITLTNRGAGDLTGITALCSGSGNPNEIYSFGPGWGAIAEDGPGVTVRAGETATFDVWTVIPEGGFVYGYVSASCYFDTSIDLEASPWETSPRAYDEAKVPGGVGSAGGLLLYDRNSDHNDEGDGVADTKIVLLDRHTGQAVARAVTDGRGHFMFRNVPADRYEVLVVGAWQITECWCPGVFAGQERDFYQVRVVPGAIQPDPDAPQDEPHPNPPPNPPAAFVAVTRLATTGVGVLAMLIGGLTMLAVGLCMVLVRRRHLPDSPPD